VAHPRYNLRFTVRAIRKDAHRSQEYGPESQPNKLNTYRSILFPVARWPAQSMRRMFSAALRYFPGLASLFLRKRATRMSAVARDLHFASRIFAALVAIRLVFCHAAPACRMCAFFCFCSSHKMTGLQHEKGRIRNTLTSRGNSFFHVTIDRHRDRLRSQLMTHDNNRTKCISQNS
jgi:hypothetical protein